MKDSSNASPAATRDHSLAAGEVQPSGAHTPGPWKLAYRDGWSIDADKGNYSTQQVFAARKAPVCIVFEPGVFGPNDRRLDANARLIAAAPTLLEALRQAAMELGEAASIIDAHYPNAATIFVKAADRARSAISLAEGGGS